MNANPSQITLPNSEYNATVCFREVLHSELIILRVKPLDGVVPNFVPGQYAELGLLNEETGKIVRRAYSISSPATGVDYLEFFLVKVEDGALTPGLFELRNGDGVFLGTKVKGKFTLEQIPRDKFIVAISTGTGIAPYISMLREFKDNPPWRKFIVIHGVRHVEDLGFRDELESLAKVNPHIKYIPVVSREKEGSSWAGLRGRVPVALADDTYTKLVGAPLTPQDSQIFLCGNPEMIVTVQALLEERGFKTHSKKHPGEIHLERYW